MKKLSLIIVLLSYCFTLSAQTLTFGFKTGVGLSKFNEKISNEIRYKPGFSFGNFLNIRIYKKLSIQAELNFEQKGQIRKAIITYTSIESIDGIATLNLKTKNKLDYITFPVLIKIRFGNKIKAFVNTGPYLAFLLCENTYINSEPASRQLIVIDNREEFKNSEIGLIGGGGIQIPLKENLYLLIDGRYNYGLTDIYVNDNIEIKNRSFGISAGIIIPL